MHSSCQNNQFSQFSSFKHASMVFPLLFALIRPRMDQQRCRVHPTLCSAAQCCSSQYFTQYFELLSDSTSAHRWLSPCSPRRPPEAPCATGGQPTPLSRPPPAFRTPIHRSGTPHYRSAWFADRHGRWPLPPAPRRSAPHAPRGGSTRPRELIERRSVQPCLKFDVKPVNILAMVSRGNGRLAHLD